MHPPGSDEPFDGARLKRFLDVDKQYMTKKRENKQQPVTKSDRKKRVFLRNRLG